jgi:hypothetical protein
MIGGAQTISSHIGAGLNAAVKEVEVLSSTLELAVGHKGISEDLEVPMEPLLFVTGCHMMRIRVNSLIPSSTSTLTHGSDARISFLDFFDRYQHRVPTNQGGYATGRWDVLLVQERSVLCSIRNRDRDFIPFRENHNWRRHRGSMILIRRADVFQITVIFKCGGSLSTVTQSLTHGLHLRLQDFDSLPQLFLLTIGLVDLHPMAVQTLLEPVHFLVDVFVPFHGTIDDGLHSTVHGLLDLGDSGLLLPPRLLHFTQFVKLGFQSICLD